MAENADTARKAYEDFNAGNPEGVLALIADEVEWVEPGGGNSPSGTFTSPQSVGQDVFAKIPENFDEFSADPENFDEQGDTVVVTGRFKGKNKSGAELDSAFTHTWRFEDGKVKGLKNEVDENWAAAWS